MENHLKSLIRYVGPLYLVLIFGCAGPTNPWGHYGLRLPPQKSEMPVNLRTIASLPNEDSDASILFFPGRQNFHQTTEFSVYIKDPNLIPDNAQLSLFYNKINVTNSWLKRAQVELNDNQTIMTLTFHGIKLMADKDHDIVVRYQRNKLSQAINQSYLSPSCSLAALEPLGELSTFNTVEKKKYRHLIEGISSQEGVNPSLVAGLIAQESAFNPLAVSSAKAIGLTQVTKGAAQHVLDTYENYPTYPELHTYPVPLIKTMILAGTVNPENEWRLDPKYSIRGGIHYLKFAEDYWLTRNNHQVIVKNYQEDEQILDDLILASYNSGPYRVKKALIKKGRQWLESPELNEAKKYVKKVKSYCYHFAANNNQRPHQ